MINKLACSLSGKTETVRIVPGTFAHRVYAKEETVEEFRCNYGLNSAYQEQFRRGGVQVSGMDLAGEVRIVELADHRYFVATLFLPQLSSSPDKPHPLIVAYLKAALDLE